MSRFFNVHRTLPFSPELVTVLALANKTRQVMRFTDPNSDSAEFGALWLHTVEPLLLLQPN